MKISVLGSNGFLSTAIAKYANRHNWELDMYGLDEPNGHAYNNFIKVNLVNNGLDCSLLMESNIIIYAIGAGIQSNLKEGTELIYQLNVSSPVSICNRLKELNYSGVFVTFGSVFEMGESNIRHPFSELEILLSKCNAPNDYTISKRMLSRFIDSYHHEFTHWHFILPTIYGVGENPKRLIPYIIDSIRNGNELHFTSGEQTRQYLHVSEVPKVMAMAKEKNLSSGIYNIPGSEILTVREIVEKIHSQFGKSVPEGCFGSVIRNDIGMKYLALNGDKLKQIIGFIPKVKIENVVRTY